VSRLPHECGRNHNRSEDHGASDSNLLNRKTASSVHVAAIFATAYLRLLTQTTKSPTTCHLAGGEYSSGKTSKKLAILRESSVMCPEADQVAVTLTPARS